MADRVLVVEDNENGIKAAAAAGAHVLAVREPVDVTYDRIRAEIDRWAQVIRDANIPRQ